MKIIEIHTQGGLKHKVQTEVYDAETLNTKLNDNDLITVLIGDFIIQRIDVKRILPVNLPVTEGTTKLEVHTNSGKPMVIITNDYDPIFLNEQLNSNNTITSRNWRLHLLTNRREASCSCERRAEGTRGKTGRTGKTTCN